MSIWKQILYFFFPLLREQDEQNARLDEAVGELDKHVSLFGHWEGVFERGTLAKEIIHVTECDDVFKPGDELVIIRTYPDDKSVKQESLLEHEGERTYFIVHRMYSRKDIEAQASGQKPFIPFVTVTTAAMAST